jgi:hypothetical protein
VTVNVACDFEQTGPPGTTLTNGNTGGTVAFGAGATGVSTSNAAWGALAGQFDVPASNVSSRVTSAVVGGTTQLSTSFKFMIPTGFATSKRLLIIQNTTPATVCSINYNGTTNRIQLQDASGAATITVTSTLTVGVWYRVELVLTIVAAGTGSYTLNLYPNNSPTPVNGVPFTGSTYDLGSVAVGGLQYGINSNGTAVAATVLIDSVRYEVGGTVGLGPEPDLFLGMFGSLVRRRPSPPRRPRMECSQPPPDLVVPPPPMTRAARRLPARPVRRGVEVVVVPTVSVPVAPGRVQPLARVRRFAVRGRRPAEVGPIPVQAVPPVAPPWVQPSGRVRRFAVRAPRPAGAVPVAIQIVAPVAPARVQSPARVRRMAAAGRRPRATTNAPPTPDQAGPVLFADIRRRLVARRTRRGAGAPVLTQVIPPVVPPRPSGRRRLLGFLRRGPGRRWAPVQPGGTPSTIPKAPHLLPGTRPGPGAVPGQGGPRITRGSRPAAGGAPGTRGQAHNEPGTRSGPTITGGDDS